MDESRFDALARTLSTSDSRRRLLASLAAVPLLGSLIPEFDMADARGRRRHARHGQRDEHHHLTTQKKKRKKRKKTCQPESMARTCSGTCGTVTNNCQQPVECGSCACDPACGACLTCQERGPKAPGACVTDAAQQGQSCGSDGKVCQPDGTCACVPACFDKDCGPDGCGGSCGACGNDQVCTTADQCCVPATCAGLGKTCGAWPDGCGGTLACGTCPTCFACADGACANTGGEVCGDACCTGTGQTCGGGGTPGECGCTPKTCAAIDQEMCQNPDDCGAYGICGTFPDGCGGTVNCGGCSHPCIGCQDNICRPIPGGEPCGPDTCCFNQCCENATAGMCGQQARCLSGICCPLGFTCCDSRDGSRRSSCYNISTYCQGQGLYCCAAGNTCCSDEPCCTSDADCTGGRRCRANGAPSNTGCCTFSF